MGAFLSHFSGEAPILEEVVSVEGFKSTSNWWMKFNNTVACVSKLSGCSAAQCCHDTLRYGTA
jgi:hypothetical protein